MPLKSRIFLVPWDRLHEGKERDSMLEQQSTAKQAGDTSSHPGTTSLKKTLYAVYLVFTPLNYHHSFSIPAPRSYDEGITQGSGNSKYIRSSPNFIHANNSCSLDILPWWYSHTASKCGLIYLWLAYSIAKNNHGLHLLEILDSQLWYHRRESKLFLQTDRTTETSFIFHGAFSCPHQWKQIFISRHSSFSWRFISSTTNVVNLRINLILDQYELWFHSYSNSSDVMDEYEQRYYGWHPHSTVW